MMLSKTVFAVGTSWSKAALYKKTGEHPAQEIYFAGVQKVSGADVALSGCHAEFADNDCALLPTQAVSEHPENDDEIGQQRSKSKPWPRRITPRIFRVN